MGNTVEAFGIGWLIGEKLANKNGKNKKQNNGRRNKVFKIGRMVGNKPKEYPFADIVDKLQDGDTVVLISDIIDSVSLDVAITIEGNGHTFFVEEGKVGITLRNDCVIQNCIFSVADKANGIKASKHNLEVYLSKVDFYHENNFSDNTYPSVIFLNFPLNILICDDVNIDYGNLYVKKLSGDLLALGDLFSRRSSIGVYENKNWSDTVTDIAGLVVGNCDVHISGKVGVFGSEEASLWTENNKSLIIDKFFLALQIFEEEKPLQKELVSGLHILGNVTINNVITPDEAKDIKRCEEAIELFRIKPVNNNTIINISGCWDVANHWVNHIDLGQIHFNNYEDKTSWYFYREEAKITWKNTKINYVNKFTPKPKPESQQKIVETPKIEEIIKPKVKSAQDQLNEMIGLTEVKKKVNTYIATSIVNKMKVKQGLPVVDNSLHLIFSGSAGTGKTQVARLLAQILYDNEIISKPTLKEATAKDMIGEYTGQTSPKTHKLILEAKGGILFIDEAYELDPSNGGSEGYKKEALTTLVKDMDDFRSDLIVVMAGYTAEMKKLLQANSGLPSRFVNQIIFEDYSESELIQIAFLQLSQQKQNLEEDGEMELKKFIHEAKESNQVNGNGRWIRNLIQFISQARDVRIVSDGSIQNDPKALTTIKKVDVCEGIDNFK